MPDTSFHEAMGEALRAYYSEVEEEKGGVTSSMLPEEVKTAMNLDLFPEDIQDDILALAQKLLEFSRSLAMAEWPEQEEAKGPFECGPDYFPTGPLQSNFPEMNLPSPTYAAPTTPSYLDRVGACLQRIPAGDIGRDAMDWGGPAGGYAGTLAAGSPTLGPYAPLIALGGPLATGAGAAAGWAAGCAISPPAMSP